MLGQKKKQQQPFMVPPPPAVAMAPQMAQGLIAPGPYFPMQGQADPQSVAPGPSPALPQLSQPTPSVPPEYFKTLQDSANNQSKMADSLQAQTDNFQHMAAPEAPQQSPFEQMLDQGIEKKMTDLLTGKKTRLEKFDSGYNRGQKLASDVLVPLMGSFGGSAGNAIGTAEATKMLKAQSAENDRSAAADKHANNASLAQLSGLWEQLSPQSAKNLLSLANAKMKVSELNHTNKNAALHEAIQARHDATQAANTAFSAALGMSKEDWSRQVDKNKADTSAMELGSTLGHRAKQEANDTTRLGLAEKGNERADKQFGLNQKSQKDQEDRFSYTKEKDKIEQGFKSKQQQLEATKALASSLTGLERDADAKTALGLPRYGEGHIERITSNPARMAILGDMLDKAGLKGVTADSLLANLKAKNQVQQAAASAGPLDGLMSGLQSLMGGSGKSGEETPPAEGAAKVAPEERTKITDAIARFRRENGGKDPSEQDLHKMLNGGK